MLERQPDLLRGRACRADCALAAALDNYLLGHESR